MATFRQALSSTYGTVTAVVGTVENSAAYVNTFVQQERLDQEHKYNSEEYKLVRKARLHAELAGEISEITESIGDLDTYAKNLAALKAAISLD